jgi:arginase
MKDIAIIECPSNLGLKEPYEGHEPGVKKLPDWLRSFDFHKKINPESVIRIEPPAYGNPIDPQTGIRNSEQVIEYAAQQAKAVENAIKENKLPLVIGGDCSIMIGNAIALKSLSRYGLFSLDGHTDFMGPDMSSTGGAAGMDLAIVTGYGHDKLTDIHHLKPYIKKEDVWCVGNREYDDAYVQLAIDAGIAYYSLDNLRETGIENCVRDFLQMIDEHQCDGFWLHFDVDVLDDAIMPAVDSRTPGGLTYNEFNELFSLLLSNKKFTGMNITILDPELDEHGIYTKPFVDNFCKVWNMVLSEK